MPDVETREPIVEEREAGEPDTIEARLERWRRPGRQGFWQWKEDIKPKILHRDNTWQEWKPTRRQHDNIDRILAVTRHHYLKHSLSLLIEPRRHGKSTVFALVCLWLITSRENLIIQLLGATEDHSRKAQFTPLKRIVRHTPRLRALIDVTKDLQTHLIRCRFRDSQIQMTAGTFATSFGEKLNILWCSDLHAHGNLDPFNAMQASLLDSEESLLFIDSNVDFDGGVTHNLEVESHSDKALFCSRVQYKDFDQFDRRAPKWIDRKKAKRLQKTTLPVDFNRDILGQRSDAVNALFSAETIQLCKSPYTCPVKDLKTLTKGREYRIGGGLDRSKSLFSGMGRSDRTIWTCILKIARPSGEPEVFILNQKNIFPNTARNIKKAVLEDHERYNLTNVVLENYEVADLASWFGNQKINCELVTATEVNQTASFIELHRLAKEGRFHFPAAMTEMAKEMKTFTYEQRAGASKYKFGHSSTKFFDDCVYSVNWSIFSLRSHVLNLYTLGSFQCFNKSPKRRLCVLMGGDLSMLCRLRCPAYAELESMFQEHGQVVLDSELTIEEFFHECVRLKGVRISQAA